MHIDDFRTYFTQYRTLCERALEQIPDAGLNALPVDDANSPAMLVRHMSGNLKSRFTDFLTADGEKPWRNRDDEFETREYSRDEIMHQWREAFALVEAQLGRLSDSDLGRHVFINKEELTVHAALLRSLAHLASHVGQVMLLGRMHTGRRWKWLTVPKRAAASAPPADASAPDTHAR